MAKLKIITLALGLIAIVLLSLFLTAENFFSDRPDSPPKFFVGIEIGWLANVNECKAIIDKVKDYTNLVIIASPSITGKEAALNETCDYAYKAGMYFMAYFSMQIFPDNYTLTNSTEMPSSTLRPFMWEMVAKQKYGNQFLGVYFNDEPGGQVLDSKVIVTPAEPVNYTAIADAYVQRTTQRMDVYSYLRDRGVGAPVFTSDYGLYWFDYQAGFDVVLAQFGWNNSRLIQIGLTRGAAKVQNRYWGAIVTWTYDVPPYLETGVELYEDLALAYDSGAKYAAIYDSSINYTDTTLTEDHFTALKNFWTYMQQNPDMQGILDADAALVLPQDYGFGFRSPVDSVWGVKPDSTTAKMYADVHNLLSEYGSGLDIVYGEAEYNIAITRSYSKVLTWTND
jgi:hypothetical protein